MVAYMGPTMLLGVPECIQNAFEICCISLLSLGCLHGCCGGPAESWVEGLRGIGFGLSRFTARGLRDAGLRDLRGLQGAMP